MRNSILLAFIILLGAVFAGCTAGDVSDQPASVRPTPQETNAINEQNLVSDVVEKFGRQLQNVSLLAPNETVAKAIQDNYGPYVSPALLAAWLKDLENAPGRVASSPWPDRIEILSLGKKDEGVYEVQGDIIDVTSVELSSGGVGQRRPVTFTVRNMEGRWLIDAAQFGACDITYRNPMYGFTFLLPESWSGYSIVTSQWEGVSMDESQAGSIAERGPLVSIRHPKWTEEHPRQDIPVMILTLAQWDSLQSGAFHIGAAPIGPTELGRNSSYVFALPARYNYAFPEGYEEVEQILNSGALQPMEHAAE